MLTEFIVLTPLSSMLEILIQKHKVRVLVALLVVALSQNILHLKGLTIWILSVVVICWTYHAFLRVSMILAGVLQMDGARN